MKGQAYRSSSDVTLWVFKLACTAYLVQNVTLIYSISEMHWHPNWKGVPGKDWGSKGHIQLLSMIT